MMKGDKLAGRFRLSAAAGLAVGIFSLDVLTPLQGAVAVLYTTVVLLTARTNDRKLVTRAGLICALLAVLAYVIGHWTEPLDSSAVRLTVSLVAIGIATFLSIGHLAAIEQRRHSDERYRTIFDAAGFPIWEADWSATYARLQEGETPDRLSEFASRNARIRDINQAAADLFGIADKRALAGRTIFRHRTPASHAALGNILAGLQEGKTTISEEAQFRTASGGMVDVILRVTLPPDHDGWKRVLVMALDVTERNRAQTQLNRSQAQLAHVSRVNLLGQLAASIAHEVNQPLSAIVTYAKSGKRWLTREAPHAGEVADCLDHIASNGTRAADVIERIRRLARKADPKQDMFELPILIEESITLLRRDLQSHDVTIRTSFEPSLPPVSGDRVQIQQVLINLLLNADQAMASTCSGGREVIVRAWRRGPRLDVEIQDSGPGLSEDSERVFGPFYTTKADGMGMGLSICRSIIELHGGRLTSANRPEGGAAFRFDLPISRHDEEGAP